MARLAFREPIEQDWRQDAIRRDTSAVGITDHGRNDMEIKRDVERFIDDFKMRRLDRRDFTARDWPLSAW